MSYPNPGQPSWPPPNQPPSPPLPPNVNSTKILAGVLGILLGSFGLQRFVLGDVSGGILRIVITVLTCGLGSVIGLVEGIIYLTKSDEQFYAEYMVGRKAWF